jgi:threonine/homoserine/homoserine lactone efflux protein
VTYFLEPALRTQVATFAGVAVLVIVTPGQDTALTIRNTLAGGRRGGISTALGVSLGQCVWALATSAGLAALLVASEPGFLAIRVVGSAYLVFLGLQALVAALRSSGTSGRPVVLGRRSTHSRAFRRGLFSNLGNPKMAVFFTSLLPQFASSFVGLLLLGFAFAGMTLLWLTAYALAVARARDVLGRPKVRRIIDAAVGTVLIVFGVRLATERG